MPPDVFKGPIARSVLKNIDKFPSLAKQLDEEVLDYDLAIEWDRRYPMSVQEHDYRSNSN
jgi:endonuclease I